MRWLDADGKPQRRVPGAEAALSLQPRSGGAAVRECADAASRRSWRQPTPATPQGFGLPGMLTLSATTGLRRTESANVLGVLPGSDPHLRNEIIVLTAHLDHLGRGSAVNGDSIYNGAHDNAVGVAVLLEMARALHVSNTKPRRSMMFAAVTAEEKGLLGSDYFAQQPARRRPAHRREHQHRHADAVRAGARFRGARRASTRPRRAGAQRGGGPRLSAEPRARAGGSAASSAATSSRSFATAFRRSC